MDIVYIVNNFCVSLIDRPSRCFSNFQINDILSLGRGVFENRVCEYCCLCSSTLYQIQLKMLHVFKLFFFFS